MLPRVLLAVLSVAVAASAFAQQAYFDFPKPNGVESVQEDDGTVQFTVTRTGSLSGAVTVEYSALEDTARAGIEYVAPSATLNFADQETQKTVSLTLIDDNESDLVSPRRLTLKLSFPRSGGGSIEAFMGIAIFDDEPPPPPLTISFSNLTHGEGDGVTNTFITASLNRPHDQMIMASFRLYVPPGDYNGVIARPTTAARFEPNQTSVQVPLEIRGNDAYDGPDPKTFHFSVDASMNPRVVTPPFDVLITEDDPQPTVSIVDVSVPEGSCGPTPIEITVATNYPANGTVEWTKSDGTATQAEIDYGPRGIYQPVYFRNSTTAKITVVAPYGDLQIEDDETFFVTLTSATNMLIGDGSATITIENDDASLPSFVDDDVRIEAGRASSLTIRFPAPAPEASVQLSSSDSHVKVPASVAVPERAMEVSFPVEVTAEATEAAGPVLVTADLPGPLGATRLTATVDAFRETPLRFDTPRRLMFAGETSTASLTFEPHREENATIALDPSPGISAPESVVLPPGGAVEFPFTALSAGRGWINATHGENSAWLAIDVVAQQVKSFAPDSASTSGGTAVTLKGLGFSPGCSARFGEVAAQTTFVNPQTLIAKTPAHPAGDVKVTVTCGVTRASAAGEFRFTQSRRRSSRH